MGFLRASWEHVWQHPACDEHLVSSRAPFFSCLFIFHLTEPNCPSLSESRQDSQNPHWPTEGSAMLILLSSSSQAHLIPLSGRWPVPISGFLKNATVKKKPLEAGLLRGSNDLVNFLRHEKSAIWFTKHGKEDIIKLADIWLKCLDQLTFIQTKMAWLAPPPELLTQEFASLTSSQVDAAPPGTPLWDALVETADYKQDSESSCLGWSPKSTTY